MAYLKFSKISLSVYLAFNLFSFGASSHTIPPPSPPAAPFYCVDNTDCSNQGHCDKDTATCHCDSGYLDDNCGYEQKSQLTAFLLHLFLGWPFGAGNFYAGDNDKGGGEIGLFWCSAILASCAESGGEDGSSLGALGIVGMAGTFVWWIVEAVRFGENMNKDGNGKPLKGW